MEEKKTIKNKAAIKKAVKNTREPKTFGNKSKGYNEFTIKKSFKSTFVEGDIVYLTKESEGIYKDKGLI